MSHFALWCSFSAPLIISAYIPALSQAEIAYLTNKDLIAVDQDALAEQATLVSQDGTWDVLTKNLANGDRLLTVLNRGNTTASYSVPLARIGIASPLRVGRRSLQQLISAKELWTGIVSPVLGEVTAVDVPSHGTQVFRISAALGKLQVTPTGMIFNTASLDCLEASGNSVSFTACNGGDGQVWQVQPSGTITSLADTTQCLEVSGGNVAMGQCQKGNGSPSQQWKYYTTGNVKNGNLCLTEGDDGQVTMTDCEWETNPQVFGLPGGVLLS